MLRCALEVDGGDQNWRGIPFLARIWSRMLLWLVCWPGTRPFSDREDRRVDKRGFGRSTYLLRDGWRSRGLLGYGSHLRWRSDRNFIEVDNVGRVDGDPGLPLIDIESPDCGASVSSRQEGDICCRGIGTLVGSRTYHC